MDILTFKSLLKYVDDHLIYTGTLHKSGGAFIKVGTITKPASHFSWFIGYGEWPNNQLNHLCERKDCVNIFHLYEGTQLHNMLDIAENEVGKFRNCSHSKDPSNIYRAGFYAPGKPILRCRTCFLAKKRKKNAVK